MANPAIIKRRRSLLSPECPAQAPSPPRQSRSRQRTIPQRHRRAQPSIQSSARQRSAGWRRIRPGRIHHVVRDIPRSPAARPEFRTAALCRRGRRTPSRVIRPMWQRPRRKGFFSPDGIMHFAGPSIHPVAIGDLDLLRPRHSTAPKTRAPDIPPPTIASTIAKAIQMIRLRDALDSTAAPPSHPLA